MSPSTVHQKHAVQTPSQKKRNGILHKSVCLHLNTQENTDTAATLHFYIIRALKSDHRIKQITADSIHSVTRFLQKCKRNTTRSLEWRCWGLKESTLHFPSCLRTPRDVKRIMGNKVQYMWNLFNCSQVLWPMKHHELLWQKI